MNDFFSVILVISYDCIIS